MQVWALPAFTGMKDAVCAFGSLSSKDYVGDEFVSIFKTCFSWTNDFDMQVTSSAWDEAAWSWEFRLIVQ